MKNTYSIHALLCFITAASPAFAEDYPDQGTREWRELFAVDPSPNALPYMPVPEPSGGLTYSARFKGEIAGFDVGRVFLDVSASDENYSVFYKMEQKGVARWFSDAEATSKARGSFGENGRIAEHYYFNHDYEAEDDQQYVEIFRRNGDRRMHLWTSPVYTFHQPVGEQIALNAVDPMAGLLALGFLDNNKGKNPCDRTVEVFDGRRLFRLVLKSEGTEKLKRRGNNVYRGTAYKCRLYQEKIAGYREDKRGDVDGDVWVYLVDVPQPFRSDEMAYVPVMIRAKQGLFTAWLEGENPTITAADGRSVNLGDM